MRSTGGLTLIELLVVMAIIGILASMALPSITNQIEEARYARAVQDIESFHTEAVKHRLKTGDYPTSWSDLGYDQPPEDPWGNDYVLNNHGTIPSGKRRKDGKKIPVNDQLDIFSPGPNGDWQSTVRSEPSLDDVILAENGSFTGKATDYQ